MSPERQKLPCENSAECMGLIVKDSDGPINRHGSPFVLFAPPQQNTGDLGIIFLLDDRVKAGLANGCATQSGLCVNTYSVGRDLDLIRAATLALCPHLKEKAASEK